jgi:hypothetical protein
MADLRAAAPVETEKIGAYLHDRSRIPAPPATDWKARTGPFLWIGLGFVLAMGAEALAFQTRSTWYAHRDWVVPMTTPILALSGVMLGYLLWRGQLMRLAWPLSLIFLALAFTAFNIWAGRVSPHHEGRDVLAVIIAVLLGVAVVWTILQGIVFEYRNPSRPPAPEV